MPQEGGENSVVNGRGGGIVRHPGYRPVPGVSPSGTRGFCPQAFPGFRPGLSSSGPTGRATAS